MQKKKRKSAFECMMNQLMREADGTAMLEECMKFDVHTAGGIPRRYRLIAYGFLNGYTLERLNEQLQAGGCEKLYARSFWEAGVIYAFQNRMSYEKWMQLQEECVYIYEETGPKEDFFTDKKIMLCDIEAYLKMNSETGEQLETRHLTAQMEQEIRELGPEQKAFRDYLYKNIFAFSSVREKTRYYFCKYFYYYITHKIENYIAATGEMAEEALAELRILKNVSCLKRKKRPDEEIRDLLYNSAISSGELFRAFNHFFFGYVSLDWMEILLEHYDNGDITSLPKSQKEELARALCSYYPEWEGRTIDEVIEWQAGELKKREEELDEIYSLNEKGRGYQRNRSGEHAVRDMLKGKLDIDRTTLSCFLLFFTGDHNLKASQKMTVGRLDRILRECGFAGLRKEEGFDFFLIQYLDSKDPTDYLMEEVTRIARNQENFYLYEMYRGARSSEQEFRRWMGIGKTQREGG